MTRLRVSASAFPEVDRYRERSARRRFGTGVVMTMMGLGVALLVAGMIYLIVSVVMLLAHVLGAQATGRIEQRFKTGTQTAIETTIIRSAPHR